MLSYIRQAGEKLKSLPSSSSREAEAVWFMKIAWNLALQCGEHYHEMGQLFSACHQVCPQLGPVISLQLVFHRHALTYHLLPLQLLGNAPLDPSALRRQKTCQLMAAAACVQVARNTVRPEDKVGSQQTILVNLPFHPQKLSHCMSMLMAVVLLVMTLGWNMQELAPRELNTEYCWLLS